MKDLQGIKDIDLVRVTLQKGYEIDTKGSSKRDIKLRKGDSVIIVNTRKNRFFDLRTDNKGSVIDFLLMMGYGWKEILNPDLSLLAVQSPSAYRPPLPVSVSSTEERSREFRKQYDSFETDLSASFLTLKRGISIDILRSFHVKSNRGCAIFLQEAYLASASKERFPTGIFRYDYNYSEDKTERRFVRGTLRSMCVQRADWDREHLFITESPIDALSYAQLYNKLNYCYLVTCGSLTEGFQKGLKRIIEAQSGKVHIILGLDNDETGSIMTGKLKGVCKELKQKYTIEIPREKDWNEDLVNSKQ